jgi:hypothetical protein
LNGGGAPSRLTNVSSRPQLALLMPAFVASLVTQPSRGRCALAILAALGYLMTIIGFPVVAPPGVSRGGTPFPCQSHACGCTSAEQCWGHCCCFTLSERLAWAATHDATPPAAVVAQAEQEQRAAKASCCASRTSCCAPSKPGKDQAAPGSPSQVRWLLGIRARGCHGQGNDWVVFSSPIAPPPARLAWAPAEIEVGEIGGYFASMPELAYAPSARPG